jgi:hypothetical protein
VCRVFDPARFKFGRDMPLYWSFGDFRDDGSPVQELEQAMPVT